MNKVYLGYLTMSHRSPLNSHYKCEQFDFYISQLYFSCFTLLLQLNAMEAQSPSDPDDDDVTVPKCVGETGMVDSSAVQVFPVEGAEGGSDTTSRDLVGPGSDPERGMTALSPTTLTSGGKQNRRYSEIHLSVFKADRRVTHPSKYGGKQTHVILQANHQQVAYLHRMMSGD